MDGLSNAPQRITIPLSSSHLGAGQTTASTASTDIDLTNAFVGPSQTLAYPNDVPKYIMTFSISQYFRQNLNSIGQFIPSGYPNIVLPLPQQMVDQNHVNWQELEVGTLPGVIVNGLASAVRGNGNAAQTGKEFLGGAVGETVADVLPGAQSIVGFSPNQFITLLMRGPTYKRHKFNFDFSPTNYQEADTLRQICLTFKNAMSPNYYQIGSGNIPVLWQFPKIFWIALYPNSLFQYKFKPCIMDFFTVNYTPGNRAAFNVNTNKVDGGNAPEGYQIQMNLIELEFWIEGNFSDNNDPTDVSSNTPDKSISNLLQNWQNEISDYVTQLQQNISIPPPDGTGG